MLGLGAQVVTRDDVNWQVLDMLAGDKYPGVLKDLQEEVAALRTAQRELGIAQATAAAQEEAERYKAECARMMEAAQDEADRIVADAEARASELYAAADARTTHIQDRLQQISTQEEILNRRLDAAKTAVDSAVRKNEELAAAQRETEAVRAKLQAKLDAITSLMREED